MNATGPMRGASLELALQGLASWKLALQGLASWKLALQGLASWKLALQGLASWKLALQSPASWKLALQGLASWKLALQSPASWKLALQNLCGQAAMLALVALGASAAWGDSGAGRTPDALSKAPAWSAPSADRVRSEVLAWLEQQKPQASVRSAAAALWSGLQADASGPEILVRMAETFALVDENARKLVQLCSKPRTEPVLPKQGWLADSKTLPLVARNMRLLFGLWLAQQSMLEEALEQLGALGPGEVVDPASLLFYQAVCHHGLLDRDAAMESIGLLLEGGDQAPRRYVAVAKMMQEDLKGLKEETLDHIARRMEDIRRRLDLGHAGKKVLQVEDGVIASLDKLIKELEERQRQQQGSAGGGNIQSSSPAQDSQILGGKGPGEVDKKKVGNKSGWGDLPPRQREEALQQIGREFPAHYRDLIEQYFRKLANEGSE